MSSKKNNNNTIAPVERRVYIYLGPSIRGVIITGSIYTGDRKQVLEKLKPAIEMYPKIEKLVVADNEIAAAKEKIRTSGNSLYAAYNALLTATKEV